KVEDYSLSGQLLRTTAVPSYQKIGNRWVPASIIILDHLKSKNVQGKVEYEKTTITITQPSLEKLPDYVYSKEYLEKINK
ncbi:MAG TPA: outer membrane lipoprotein-sorting protein, partial [Spirochaetales bacterium]|nr:outer membrane lipoprotein-sorting protein [Spirochaetales bacterium]